MVTLSSRGTTFRRGVETMSNKTNSQKAVQIATFLLAQRLGIKKSERASPQSIPMDTAIENPAELKVAVEEKGGCELRLPACDFLEGTTWGAILEANGFENLGNPIADYSPNS